MKVHITENGQFKMGTAMVKNPEMDETLRFLLYIRHMDRLDFARGLTGLIVKAATLALNLVDKDYNPVVIPLIQIVCKRNLRLDLPP